MPKRSDPPRDPFDDDKLRAPEEAPERALEDEELPDEELPDEDDDLFLDDELFPEGPGELSHDELLAESEYNVRAASAGDLDLARHGDSGERDDLSVAPEDLGRYALLEATQDPQPVIDTSPDDEAAEGLEGEEDPGWPAPRGR